MTVPSAIAFATSSPGVPPYQAALRWSAETGLVFQPNFESLALIFGDDLYIAAFLNSLLTAAIATLGCLLLGYTIAYGIATAAP